MKLGLVTGGSQNELTLVSISFGNCPDRALYYSFRKLISIKYV